MWILFASKTVLQNFFNHTLPKFFQAKLKKLSFASLAQGFCFNIALLSTQAFVLTSKVHVYFRLRVNGPLLQPCCFKSFVNLIAAATLQFKYGGEFAQDYPDYYAFSPML